MVKRYIEGQIIEVLKEAGAGTRTADICRQHGVSDATFYKWKANSLSTMFSMPRVRKQYLQCF